MYSVKSFFEFCPNHIINEQDRNDIEALLLRSKRIDESNERALQKLSNVNHTLISDLYVQRLTSNEVTTLNTLNHRLINKYIEDGKTRPFEDFDAAISALFQETSRVYNWFTDVSLYRDNLSMNEKDTASDQYARNYWYFMEWQSDLFSVLDALMYANNKILDLHQEQLNKNFSIVCGLTKIKNPEDLLSRVFSLFETAYAWAYVNEEKNWINNDMENSSEESFKEHVQFFARLIQFINLNLSHFNQENINNETFKFLSLIERES